MRECYASQKKDEMPSESPKKRKWIEVESDDDTGECLTYDKLMDRARKRLESDWSKKVEKYIERGLSRKEAKQKADAKFALREMDEFFRHVRRVN